MSRSSAIGGEDNESWEMLAVAFPVAREESLRSQWAMVFATLTFAQKL